MSVNMPGDYEYRVWRDMAGAGRRVWRWEVRSRATGSVIMAGVSFDSERAAKDNAISAIKRLNFQPRS